MGLRFNGDDYSPHAGAHAAGGIDPVAGGGGGGSGTPASTVVAETTYGQASVVGAGTNYAREDHTHGSPALGTTGTTAAAGNHTHPASTIAFVSLARWGTD